MRACLLLLGLAAAGCAGGPAPRPTADGEPAPDVELPALDGGPTRLSSMWAGRPVLFVFMTSW